MVCSGCGRRPPEEAAAARRPASSRCARPPRGGDRAPASLTKEERALVEFLLDGLSPARLARRTADRRLAAVLPKLGVETTVEALRRSPTVEGPPERALVSGLCRVSS